MNPRSSAVLVAALLLGLGGRALAADDVAPVASSDPLRHLINRGRFREAYNLAAGGAEALAAGGTDAAKRQLGLMWAVLRAGSFSLDRQDDEAEVKRALATAQERARPEDLALLHDLERSERLAPYARSVARAAVARIDARTDRPMILSLLRGDDGAARRRALAALGERLERLRAKVDAGGELDILDQAELADPELIQALVELLPSRDAGADELPHDLAAQVTPSALHVLALVEAPAIPALEAARRRGVSGAAAALEAVHAGALERIRRHPSSSWSSARGALPSLMPGALPCSGCRRPLPDGAHFCPACGAKAEGAPCPRCGANVEGEICPRCGGVARGEVRKCDRCGEFMGVADRFCRRCGGREGEPVPKPK